MIVTDETIKAISEHAEEGYPFEVCGFLFGSEEPRVISHSKRAVNTKAVNQEKEFSIDAKDYMNAENYAVDNKLDFLGIYHSHPDHPARPSEYDRSHGMPFFSYIILSVQKGRVTDITSWRLNDQSKFDPELFNQNKGEK